jgi:hypothetical protein
MKLALKQQLVDLRINPPVPRSLFFSSENEAVTHKLQPSSQNPLSFVCNFCQGLTFAKDCFALGRLLN